MDAIDTALVGVLEADSTLDGLAPGGVFFDLAPAGVTEPYVLVSQQASEDDYVVGRVGEHLDGRDYLSKAVGRATGATPVDAAAARVTTLLNGADLAPTGYRTLLCRRRQRVRFVEVDGDRRWQHSGGVFETLHHRL